MCVGKVMKCSMFPKIAKIYILSEEKTYLAFGVPFIDMLIFWFPILSTFENKKYFAITFLCKRDLTAYSKFADSGLCLPLLAGTVRGSMNEAPLPHREVRVRKPTLPP